MRKSGPVAENLLKRVGLVNYYGQRNPKIFKAGETIFKVKVISGDNRYVTAHVAAAIGLERQWSGHADGPAARFAGIRTFTLLGGLGGMAGWLWLRGYGALAVVLLAALFALAYMTILGWVAGFVTFQVATALSG